ncbi:MAG: M48 family metallopeptidase [Acidobacteria bacterium]|nr:M48 family metallopeptidase [Acidobacteriota bacterium]MCI0723573.1 M48 family metallopeptidase [Acidobacteriota bacterium]
MKSMKTSVAISLVFTLCLSPSGPLLAADKKKHSDVEEIGNRDINKGSWNMMSIEKEIALGKQLAQDIERQVKLIDDPEINEFVSRLGQNLVRNSDAKVPFTIKVVDSDEINAFALPGGFFYVNSGLITSADEEAELAGVMAHEIAHVAARHGTEQYTKGTIANYATLPLIFLGGGLGYGLYQAAGFLIPLKFLQFSRSAETEADFLGLQYVYKTGYDPTAFVSFFEKIQAQEKKKPGKLSKAFSTHPPTADRIEKTQVNISTILPEGEQYVINTSEFDHIKGKLLALENRKRPAEGEKSNRPSLKRRTSGEAEDASDEPTEKDDDRPTLKRRTN